MCFRGITSPLAETAHRQVICYFKSQVTLSTFFELHKARTLPVIGQSGKPASSAFHVMAVFLHYEKTDQNQSTTLEEPQVCNT